MAFVRTEDLCFSCWNRHQGVTSSKRRFQREAITFFVGAFLWWVTNHGEKKKNKHSMSGWWCGARVENRATGGRLFSSQVGHAVHDQIGVSAYAAPGGECDNLFCAPKLVSKLLNGNRLRIVVRRLEDGSQRKITDAVRQFVSADNQRG